MRDRASVVIVGGGVVGASIAYHLAVRGLTDVVVVERFGLASGSTGRSAGGVRQQFSTEVNCRMSLLSTEKLVRFPVEVGWDPRFHQVGYLFLLSRESDWQAFQRNVELQQRLGLDVELVSPHAAQEMVPPVVVDDLHGATFCGTDGHADPTQVCLGYASQARERGVEIWSGAAVTDIFVGASGVEAVQVDAGRLSTPLVVNAAGPWAAEVARMAGIEVPIRPYRRQLYYVEDVSTIPRSSPMVVDFGSSMYFRPEGPGLLLGMTDRSEPSSCNMDTDEEFLAMLIENAVRRVPALERARVVRGWAGLYDVTPDANPVLGPVPGLRGFLMAAGFSGHGFMHSPATGQLVAEMIIDGCAHTIDVSSFSIERFVSGAVAREQTVI